MWASRATNPGAKATFPKTTCPGCFQGRTSSPVLSNSCPTPAPDPFKLPQILFRSVRACVNGSWPWGGGLAWWDLNLIPGGRHGVNFGLMPAALAWRLSRRARLLLMHQLCRSVPVEQRQGHGGWVRAGGQRNTHSLPTAIVQQLRPLSAQPDAAATCAFGKVSKGQLGIQGLRKAEGSWGSGGHMSGILPRSPSAASGGAAESRGSITHLA